jgi:hypothetical protein
MSGGHGRRPSAATLVAAGALVLALVGSAIAGTPAKVGKLINGADIKPRSEPANRIVKDGLTGKQIDEATLGKVPKVKHATSATHATNATSADTATTAGNANTVGGESAADLTIRCRPNTTLLAGGCIETGAARAPDSWINATFDCGARTLPTIPQLQALAAQGGHSGVEMTGTLINSTTEFTVDLASGAVGTAAVATSLPFRCVAAPANF